MSGPGYAGSRAFWLPDQPPTSSVAYYGAPQTISVMRRAVLDDQTHFQTRQLAESVCEGLASKDYVSEYLALYNFLLQRTRYMRDPRGVELVKAPYVICGQIMSGHRPSIDCDELSSTLAALITSVGGVADFCTVAFQRMFYQGRQQYSHVFCRALEPRTREWIILDPVAAERTPQMLRRVKAAETWPVAV